MSTPDVVEPGRMQGEDAPAAPNQHKTEPVPPAAQQDVPGDGGTRADAGEGTSTGPGPREGSGVASLAFSHAESGGDAKGVPVPSETAAEGTSETASPVEGVRTTALAPEGLADGEPDTRAPSTGTF